MTEGDLSWDVTLPERGARTSTWQRSRARLHILSPEHGEEDLSVPVAVGRRLQEARETASAPTSRQELLALVDELSTLCAHARMEELIARRDLSAHELRERLGRDGYQDRVIDDIVARAERTGLVDDARFAAAFVRSKASVGWGRLKISRELAQRGIDIEGLGVWPDELLCEEGELERARELAGRRRLTGQNDRQKIMRFLCGRGFSASVAARAAREATDDEEEPMPSYHGLI